MRTFRLVFVKHTTSYVAGAAKTGRASTNIESGCAAGEGEGAGMLPMCCLKFFGVRGVLEESLCTKERANFEVNSNQYVAILHPIHSFFVDFRHWHYPFLFRSSAWLIPCDTELPGEGNIHNTPCVLEPIRNTLHGGKAGPLLSR